MKRTLGHVYRMASRRLLPVVSVQRLLHASRHEGPLLTVDAVEREVAQAPDRLRLLRPWSGVLAALEPYEGAAIRPRAPWELFPEAYQQRARARRRTSTSQPSQLQPLMVGREARSETPASRRANEVAGGQSGGHSGGPPVTGGFVVAFAGCEAVDAVPRWSPTGADTDPTRTLLGHVSYGITCLGMRLWTASARDRARWLEMLEEAERLQA